MKLTMASSRANVKPSPTFQEFDEFLYLHFCGRAGKSFDETNSVYLTPRRS